jgi:hypothetical protein
MIAVALVVLLIVTFFPSVVLCPSVVLRLPRIVGGRPK